MPTQCPTCSRTNPADAAFCFYDGRPLGAAGPHGPAGLGTRPFPLPFSFSDGQGCANYNQLVLACDRRWNEARTNLLNGTWASFFGALGRADLAALAQQAAREADPDVGLCRLLEGLPADAEALRPPKLGLTAPAEDLGTLEPGKDHAFPLVLANQGMLLLRGAVLTDCEWLTFGERQGDVSTKYFQTRDTYTLTVRVEGRRLRAGKKPLEGQVVIDTNGGRETVAVRVAVPVRPFPHAGHNVLAGAASPRELAVKAKEHPAEAAALFEQGAVKAWYESNGWTYPIQGTQARGKGALQQFFEALGLAKSPRLDIDTERIDCRGAPGQRLTRNVVLRTGESKFVYAEAQSDQGWVKVLPAKSHGNSVTVPLRIEVPPSPGQTLRAVVTFHGNGRQRFVVPVTLAIADVPVAQKKEEEPSRGGRPLLVAAGAGLCLLLALVAGGAALIFLGGGGADPDPVDPPPIVQIDPPVPPPQGKAWWDGIPGANLAAPLAALRGAAGENKPSLDGLEAESNDERRKGYERLAAKLPELARDPAARLPLGQFVTGCCVHEPSDFNLAPLVRGVAAQFPAEDRAFPPGDRGEGVERAAFWLGVVADAVAHRAARPGRSRDLAGELGKALGFDSDAPPAEIRERAEKSLAELCYHDTPPTAEKSLEQALAIREVLIAKFARHLPPDFRVRDDVKLLAAGLPRGAGLWPKLKPLAETCVQSEEAGVAFRLVEIYEKADAALAPHMEEVLATRWKVAGNARLAHADKAAALRNSMAASARAAKVSREQRVRQWQELWAKSPRPPDKPGGQPPGALLQDAVRLSHASTMACLLLSKEAEPARFDELVAAPLTIEAPKAPEEEKRPEEKPRQADGKVVLEVFSATRRVTDALTPECAVDPRRGAYRKEHLVHLKEREIYSFSMQSAALACYLRLETMGGKELASDKGARPQITFVPQASADYRLVASSTDKGAVGPFTLEIAHRAQPVIRFGGRLPFFGKPFPGIGPGVMPGVGPGPGPGPGPGVVEGKGASVNQGDLNLLADKRKDVRTAAFRNLAGSVPNDLAYRHARRLAAYLLLTEWADGEADVVAESLPPLAGCRHLLQALSDAVGGGGKLSQPRTEAVVGALLGKAPLRFGRDEDWRLECRRLLLRRALELTGRAEPANTDADRAADLLRDLYREQGLAFGLDDADAAEPPRLTAVLERLTRHVAARAAKRDLAPADKAALEQVGRQLKAAEFAAANDLEHAVLLQRVWVKVLALELHGRAEESDRKAPEAVLQDLEARDRRAGHLLDQLRSGEEAALRLWALARDLKTKSK